MKAIEGKSIDHEEAMVQAYQVFQKVWSSFTKGLFRQIVIKNRIVCCPLLGVWMQSNNLRAADYNTKSDDSNICFMPSAQWAHPSLNYESQPPLNLPVVQQADWANFGIDGEPIKVNYAEIAKASDTIEAAVVYILKQIIAAIQNTVAKDYQVKLNMRIGWLKVIN